MSVERTRAVLTAIRQTAERQLKQIDGLLAMLDEEPRTEETPPQVVGCQHARTVDISTLNQRGALCVDCNQTILSDTGSASA